jgi:hypothetical protein
MSEMGKKSISDNGKMFEDVWTSNIICGRDVDGIADNLRFYHFANAFFLISLLLEGEVSLFNFRLALSESKSVAT